MMQSTSAWEPSLGPLEMASAIKLITTSLNLGIGLARPFASVRVKIDDLSL